MGEGWLKVSARVLAASSLLFGSCVFSQREGLSKRDNGVATRSMESSVHPKMEKSSQIRIKVGFVFDQVYASLGDRWKRDIKLNGNFLQVGRDVGRFGNPNDKGFEISLST